MSLQADKYVRAYLSIFKGETYSYIVPLPFVEVKLSLKELLATTGIWIYPNITGELKGDSFYAHNRWGGMMRPQGPEASVKGELSAIDSNTSSMYIKTTVHIAYKTFAIVFPTLYMWGLTMYLVTGEKIISNLSFNIGLIMFALLIPFFTVMMMYRAYSMRKELREVIENHLNIKPLPENPAA